MATSTKCPNPACKSKTFELAEESIQEAEYKLHIVRCSQCGTAVNTIYHYDPGITAKENERKLAALRGVVDQLARSLGNMESKLDDLHRMVASIAG